MIDDLLKGLARAKATFQQRAILAVVNDRKTWAPEGKARWDCECGNMHYASLNCKSVHCPRCHMQMEKDP